MSNTFQIEHLSFTTATVPASEYIKLALVDGQKTSTTPYLLTFIPSQQLWFTKHDLNDPESQSDLDNQLQSLGMHLLRLDIQDTRQATSLIKEKLSAFANQRLAEFTQHRLRFN